MKCNYCERESTEWLTASAGHTTLCSECEEHLEDMAQWVDMDKD